MNLTKLLYGADAVYNGNDPDIRFITHKPDDVADGALFVCIKGAHADGHDFAHTAISKGAVAVVCERDLGIAEQVMVPNSRAALSLLNCAFYGHPSKSMLLIGVTGTNGKTTTACYIRNMLEQAGRKSVLIGTLGADSGNGTAQTDYTTPESAVFNHTLQKGLQRGCEYAVAEISSQALSQERCAGMDFDVAVFTNLSPEHLDYHQTMDEYARQKAKLFACAKAAAVNKDDEFAPFILSHCKGRTVTFSLQDDADLTAKNVKYTAHGVSYILVSRDGIERIQIPALGIMAVTSPWLRLQPAWLPGLILKKPVHMFAMLMRWKDDCRKYRHKHRFRYLLIMRIPLRHCTKHCMRCGRLQQEMLLPCSVAAVTGIPPKDPAWEKLLLRLRI